MRKRLITICMVLGLIGLSACGKKEEAPVTQEVITVSFNTTIKAPNQMSKSELLALSPAAIREMVETYLPNYRSIYKIDADYKMAEADWTNLRDLIVDQLYGTGDKEEEEVVENKAAGVDFSNPDKIMGEDGSYLDPDWIYYAPCKEYIEQLTDAEFVTYLGKLMAYWDRDVTEEDFASLSTKELDEVRLMVFQEFCREWGSVVIPTVKSLNREGIYNAFVKEGISLAWETYKTQHTADDLFEAYKEYGTPESVKDILSGVLTYEISDEDVTDLCSGYDGVTEDMSYDDFVSLVIEETDNIDSKEAFEKAYCEQITSTRFMKNMTEAEAAGADVYKKGHITISEQQYECAAWIESYENKENGTDYDINFQFKEKPEALNGAVIEYVGDKAITPAGDTVSTEVGFKLTYAAAENTDLSVTDFVLKAANGETYVFEEN